MSDASCMIGMTAEDMAGFPPLPAFPPVGRFEEPTAGELEMLDQGRVMLDVTVCGEGIGTILGVVAIEGAKFRTSYGDLVEPMLRGVDVSEINDRWENPMRLTAANGTDVTELPAGKFRFGHSPDNLDSMDALRGFHDQNEGCLARFRLYPATLGGKRAIVMKGSVLASVLEPGATTPRPTTWADLDQIAHAETSPEWFEDGPDGQFVYIAHAFVGEGNTNLYDDTERARLVAQVRRANPTDQETEMAETEPETTADCATCATGAAEAEAAAEQAAAEAQAEFIARFEALENDHRELVQHLMGS